MIISRLVHLSAAVRASAKGQRGSNRPPLLRRPITVTLDRGRQNYDIGAILRRRAAFLCER
jgi:hypothetical protein